MKDPDLHRALRDLIHMSQQEQRKVSDFFGGSTSEKENQVSSAKGDCTKLGYEKHLTSVDFVFYLGGNGVLPHEYIVQMNSDSNKGGCRICRKNYEKATDIIQKIKKHKK